MTQYFDVWDVIGYIAGLLCAIQNVPQIYKLYQTKSSKDISIHFLIIGITSGLMWLIYAINEGNIPVLLFGISEVILLGMVLFLTYKYRPNNDEPEQVV
jgi:MtN3 and saliva related transmembrane protein